MTEKPKGKRKILVLAPSLKSIGGVQNYIRTFVDALNSVIGSDCVRVVAVAEDPKVAADGILALSTSAKIRFLVSTVTNALTWSPDLIICAHVGLAPAARIVQKITGTSYWLILYGIEVWGDLPPAKVEALRGAERYITITQFTLDAMAARHNLKQPRASILPPTLPKPPLRSGDENYSLRKEWDRPIVLTVGRIAASERYKGHDAIFDAWPEVLRCVPDAEYWIVGDGDDRSRLESRAGEMGVTESVHFKGSVSQQELDVCYDRCTVFAMPARTELDARTPRGEGFGIVFLEAMARGKPVIGPRVGAPAEFIRSGEHGLLVDPANPGEIARALIELLQDPARSRSMGEAGRDWVAREFTFDRFCERLRDALQE